MPRTDAVWDWGDSAVPQAGPCALCGVDVSQAPQEDLGPAILALLPRWTAALMRPGVRCAAGPLTRSALEHAIQVRDRFGAVAARFGRLLHEDDPLLSDWTRSDDTARGGVEDPVRVAVELDDAGRAVAARLDALDPHRRAPHESGPAGSAVTVLSLARHLVHDVVHRLHDVNAGRPSDEELAPKPSYPQNLSTGL